MRRDTTVQVGYSVLQMGLQESCISHDGRSVTQARLKRISVRIARWDLIPGQIVERSSHLETGQTQKTRETLHQVRTGRLPDRMDPYNSITHGPSGRG